MIIKYICETRIKFNDNCFIKRQEIIITIKLNRKNKEIKSDQEVFVVELY
jgi:hypothetical protein